MNGVDQEKDAYYFSHDANARNDHKITKLMIDLKAEGYGIYWVIIEMLREQKNYTLNKTDYEAIAYQSHSNSQAISKVIEQYDLFEFDDKGNFYSESLIRRMKALEEKRTKLSNAGKKGNLIRWQSQGNRKAIAVKESKVKESKVDSSASHLPLKAKLSDDEFIITLKANASYNHINIDAELGKMDAWILTHPGRQKTRRFIVNWLNKIEKPFTHRSSTVHQMRQL